VAKVGQKRLKFKADYKLGKTGVLGMNYSIYTGEYTNKGIIFNAQCSMLNIQIKCGSSSFFVTQQNIQSILVCLFIEY